MKSEPLPDLGERQGLSLALTDDLVKSMRSHREVVDDVELDLPALDVGRVRLAVLPPQGLPPKALVDVVPQLPAK